MATIDFKDLGELSDLDQDNLYTTTKDQASALREGVQHRRSARRGARRLAERAQARKAGAAPSARSDEHWKYATAAAESRAKAKSEVLKEQIHTFNSNPRAGEVFNQVAEQEAHLGTTGSNPLPPRTTKMPTNKKTAMQEFWARSAKQTERLSQTRTESRLDDPFPENGEMRPGVAERTRVHHLQSRVVARRPAWGSTSSSAPAIDLGEKPFNVTSSNPNRLYIDTKSQAVGSRQHAEFSRFVAGEKKLDTPKNPLAGQGDLGEVVPGAAKAQGLRHRALTRALRERRAALRGDPIKANQVQALSGEEKAAVDAAAKAEVERVRTQAKASKEATVKARTITDEELFSGQSKEPIGKGRKDLGRSVTRGIRAGQPGDTELLKIARRRSIAGRSIAGPDPAKPPTMAARARAARAAGKLGGRLGAYGAIRSVFEGAETLRKLKTGAYDLTPEGLPKLKKGHVES